MAVNMSKVVVGGLAAGVVGNVVGFVGFGMMLGPRFNAEMDAVVPGLSATMATGMNMGMGIASQFVIGILLAWLYASMRPRYGAGAGTALRAAFVVWLCGFLFYMDNWQAGMMSTASYLMAAALMVVGTGASALTAGVLYKEDGA
jgi:hypothetical protein